ncbi:MAG: SurA N-terminal domain-containing protein [Hyphomicrobiaceae bacterium]|nr:SurA N-terminal domain-containing protein [Hyphomicrobiaceae bacterium]
MPPIAPSAGTFSGPSATALARAMRARRAACALAMALLGGLALTAPAPAESSNQILVLVNDEPITAYEMEQRQRLIGLSADVGSYIRDNAKKRWESIVKNPKINEEFRAFAVKRNPKSKEDLQKIQQEFVKGKQKVMMDQLQQEARSRALKGTDKMALKELVEERLKLQEAKRNNVLATDEQISKIITGIASRNKMNEEQFAKHLAGMGVDISTMKQRFRASISWNEVVRRRFGYQISITERDVERFVDQEATVDDGSAGTEVSVQRVVLAATSLDQKAMAERLAVAEQIRQKFAGCKSTEKVAKSFGATFEDLGSRSAGSIPDPARTMLLGAKEGQMIPPNVGADGVEMWVLCGRKQSASAGKTGAPGAGGGAPSEKDERRQKELEILAKRHMKDLRQDATIDCRADAKSGLCQAL